MTVAEAIQAVQRGASRAGVPGKFRAFRVGTNIVVEIFEGAR